MREDMHVWGREVYENSLYLFNFAVNLKLLEKISFNLKKLPNLA